VPGDTLWTMEQENHFEAALANHGRSTGQWDIWQAVFGPQGADGYPAPIWDKQTGEIDHAVAEEWRAMDLSLYVQDHWAEIGRRLAGRLHVFVGDDDTFFLNNGVSAFQAVVEGLRSPRARATFEYGADQPHCWGPSATRLLTMMASAMRAAAPATADTSWWSAPTRPVEPGRVSSVQPYGRRGHGV
jgi:hypothetical protein